MASILQGLHDAQAQGDAILIAFWKKVLEQEKKYSTNTKGGNKK